MHLHIIISSRVFTTPIIQRIKEYYQEDSIILITTSYRKIRCIMPTGERTMDIFAVVRFLKQQCIITTTAHFLSSQAAYIIRSLPKGVIVKWVVWGGDFYGLPHVRKTYLINQSRHDGLKARIGYKLIKVVLKRIDVIAANPCDQMEIEKQLQLNVEYLRLNHLLTMSNFPELHSTNKPNTLLLGNSDDQYNNHEAVIDKLSTLVSRDTHVIIPLSGVSSSYTLHVGQRAKAEFDNTQILNRFIEKEEYYSILSTCSTLVFGHLRQQGMATLFSFLLSGRKCYFFRQNPYYQFLRAEGYHVFALEEVETSQFWKPITDNQARENSHKLKEMVSSQNIDHQWKIIFEYNKH